jgi:hypothetical protein
MPGAWIDALVHFICLIDPPSAEFAEKAAMAGGEPGPQIQKAPEWFDRSTA